MARRRKPEPLKALHGTDQPSRKRATADFMAKAPNPPTWLGREAKAEWRRIVPELDRLRLLTTIDRAILVTWCDTWQMYVRASRSLGDRDPTFETESGYPQQRPEVGIMAKARSDMRQLAPMLGMTAVGRAKQTPVNPLEDPASKWDVVK